MLPFVLVGLGLLAYIHWQGDAIAANHANSVTQAVSAASAVQATPAAARTAAPLIIGPPGAQTTLTQTGESIATHAATAPAFNPPPVAPTVVLPAATVPQSISTSATGAPTGPLSSSATAIQSTPIVTVPATVPSSAPTVTPPTPANAPAAIVTDPVPPPHDVGTPPVFAASIQNVPATSYAPVVPFTPTILSPALTCAGIIPGQR